MKLCSELRFPSYMLVGVDSVLGIDLVQHLDLGAKTVVLLHELLDVPSKVLDLGVVAALGMGGGLGPGFLADRSLALR